jgi:hypothetical protein
MYFRQIVFRAKNWAHPSFACLRRFLSRRCLSYRGFHSGVILVGGKDFAGGLGAVLVDVHSTSRNPEKTQCSNLELMPHLVSVKKSVGK